MPINSKIQIRKGSASEWDAANPILDLGEPGFDTTNNILKIGDGINNWNNLNPISVTNDNSQNQGGISYGITTLFG
jgi:hypothetical protein